MMSEYKEPVVYFCLKSKFGNKVYDQINTGTLTITHILPGYEVLMIKYFLHNRLRHFRIDDALGKGYLKP